MGCLASAIFCCAETRTSLRPAANPSAYAAVAWLFNSASAMTAGPTTWLPPPAPGCSKIFISTGGGAFSPPLKFWYVKAVTVDVNMTRSDDIFIVSFHLQTYLALGFESAGHVDGFLLRERDVARPHRPQDIHIFFEHVGGARRHAFEDVAFKLFAGTFQGHAEGLLVDLREQFADAGFRCRQQIFKSEHHVADGQGDLGVGHLDLLQH